MDSVAQLIAVLDGMPDALRGLLSALLLLLLLIAFDIWVRRGRDLAAPAAQDDSLRGSWRRLRLSFRGHRWRIAHTKTSLLALVLIPLASTLLASLRLPFFVEALPAEQSFNHWWLHGPLLAWLAIAVAIMIRQLYRWRQDATRSMTADGAPVTEAINKRALHWRRRLGIEDDVVLRIGPVAVPVSARWPKPTITLPRAALHWPAAATDVALIQQLCQFALAHHRWQLVAALIGALYWPFRFVREVLPHRLQEDFALAAAELAGACYRDPLGYRRATKALQERLDSAPQQSVETLHPELANTDPNDPYGRVFLVFVQALLMVYVLTGTTLREVPDDSNFRYAEFVDDWYESFTRSIKSAPEPAAGDARRGPISGADPLSRADLRSEPDRPSRPAAPAAPPAALPER